MNNVPAEKVVSAQEAQQVREMSKWQRKWPHDQPNGWNLNADEFLALIKSAEGMMWLALGRAKYIELRVDTRDCAFNLYDRDHKPLNPDEVVEAIAKVKRDFLLEPPEGSLVLKDEAQSDPVSSPQSTGE